jgi:photosystem II stability/assembly factor-like uncharacterized protein
MPAVNSIRACFPTEKIGYLVSLMQLFRTEDGGLTWNPASGLTWGASYLSDCWFADPDTGFIAAVKYGSVVRTDNGGTNTRPVLAASTNRVRFLNRQIGYAISVTDMQRTVNGGNDWSPDGEVYDFIKSGVSLRALVVNGASVAIVTGNKGFIIRHTEGSPTVANPSVLHSSARHRYAMSRKGKSIRLDGRALASTTGDPASPAYIHP